MGGEERGKRDQRVRPALQTWLTALFKRGIVIYGNNTAIIYRPKSYAPMDFLKSHL